MIRIVEVADIVDACTYKPGWRIYLRADAETAGKKTDRFYIQLEVDATARAAVSSVAPHPIEPWKSGKRYLSLHMCRQEIVGVIFDLIKAAEDHEMREWFRYKGASIYNPHLDPDVLVNIAKRKSSFVMRDNPMSMDEQQCCHCGAQTDLFRTGGRMYCRTCVSCSLHISKEAP